MKKKKITVVAAESQLILDQQGSDVDQSFDTVEDAKKYAKRVLTDEYHQLTEATTQLGYSQVLVDGACEADYFRKKE